MLKTATNRRSEVGNQEGGTSLVETAAQSVQSSICHYERRARRREDLVEVS